MAKKRYDYKLPDHDVEYGVELAVNSLKIDVEAQRTLNKRRAEAIAKGLVKEAMGAIVVSRRPNGDTYIVDGMHRHYACQFLGIEKIMAEVHHGLSQQEEAILFLIKNRESSKPSALDEFKVGLTAGVPLFVDTYAVLQQHNLELGASSTNSIGAVSGVLRITQEHGQVTLDRTLTVVEKAWGRDRSTWDGVLLSGVSEFLGRHGDVVDDDALLAEKIAKAGHAAGWIGTVHAQASGGGMHNSGTGSRISTCYRLVVDAWNKGRRKGSRIELR
ncbi:hypothetical protein GCM10009730_48810 [Streptomyces albidochromogenes]|uniref:DUF6551 family protein n=1 Tax=Streptomyces albidochromogenes TaxID=329524 RepID=UPI00110FA0D3|nr:DUF6551 family protein [Streptomyces albidochromogenes]